MAKYSHLTSLSFKGLIPVVCVFSWLLISFSQQWIPRNWCSFYGNTCAVMWI